MGHIIDGSYDMDHTICGSFDMDHMPNGRNDMDKMIWINHTIYMDPQIIWVR